MTQDIGTAIQRVKDFPRLAEWFTLLVTNKITILRYCFDIEKLGLIGLKSISFIIQWNGRPSGK
jgi:hypothetical protein